MLRTIQFDVYPGVESVVTKAEATILGKDVLTVRVLSKIPRSQYYSVLNDAGKRAEEISQNEKQRTKTN